MASKIEFYFAHLLLAVGYFTGFIGNNNLNTTILLASRSGIIASLRELLSQTCCPDSRTGNTAGN